MLGMRQGVASCLKWNRMTLSLPRARIVCVGRARRSARPFWFHARTISGNALYCVHTGRLRAGRPPALHSLAAEARDGAHCARSDPRLSSSEDADASEVTRSSSLHGKHRLLFGNRLLLAEWSRPVYLGSLPTIYLLT